MEPKMEKEKNLKVVNHKNVEKICGAGPDENAEDQE
jgi:hypothetical protein